MGGGLANLWVEFFFFFGGGEKFGKTGKKVGGTKMDEIRSGRKEGW